MCGLTSLHLQRRARALHDYGKRRNGPFVAINMAAIPRELIESELFGFDKAGAAGGRGGIIEAAGQPDQDIVVRIRGPRAAWPGGLAAMLADAFAFLPGEMKFENAAPVKAIEPDDIHWFEEPISPEDIDGYRELKSLTSIWLAAAPRQTTGLSSSVKKPMDIS